MLRTTLMLPVLLSIGFGAAAQDYVRVVVDMDAARPGIQSHVVAPPGATSIEGIAIYVYDPSGGHSVMSIGYLGGIDRGIGFGHAPDSAQQAGRVTGLTATPGTAVNRGNTPWPEPEQMLIKVFEGPEVQYVEFGASEADEIATAAIEPIFRVDVALADAQPCDVYEFFLLDVTALWAGSQHGAFSSSSVNELDSGGDAVPDGTPSEYGVDLDVSVPAPPAAFLVDYIDGEAFGQGARIIVGPRGDITHDCHVDLMDLAALLANYGCSGDCSGDVDGDADVDLADLAVLLANFGR